MEVNILQRAEDSMDLSDEEVLREYRETTGRMEAIQDLVSIVTKKTDEMVMYADKHGPANQ